MMTTETRSAVAMSVSKTKQPRLYLCRNQKREAKQKFGGRMKCVTMYVKTRSIPTMARQMATFHLPLRENGIRRWKDRMTTSSPKTSWM